MLTALKSSRPKTDADDDPEDMPNRRSDRERAVVFGEEAQHVFFVGR